MVGEYVQLVPSKHAGAIVGAIDDGSVGAIVGALVGVGVAITLTTKHHCTVCDPNGKDATVRFHNARCLEDTNRDVMVKLRLRHCVRARSHGQVHTGSVQNLSRTPHAFKSSGPAKPNM